jgi:alanine-alpha-ketoisovalerate/valine-pyruvate aminotransferase
MRTIRIPIIENKQGTQAKLFNKLSYDAKKLFVVISRMSQPTGSISIDDIRNLNKFGDTSNIEQLLYALESRGFGEVKIIGAETYFIPNRVLAASVL